MGTLLDICKVMDKAVTRIKRFYFLIHFEIEAKRYV